MGSERGGQAVSWAVNQPGVPGDAGAAQPVHALANYDDAVGLDPGSAPPTPAYEADALALQFPEPSDIRQLWGIKLFQKSARAAPQEFLA